MTNYSGQGLTLQEILSEIQEGEFVFVRKGLGFSLGEISRPCCLGVGAKIRFAGLLGWFGHRYEVSRVGEHFTFAEYTISDFDGWTKYGAYLALGKGVDFWETAKRGQKFRASFRQTTDIRDETYSAAERYNGEEGVGPNMEHIRKKY